MAEYAIRKCSGACGRVLRLNGENFHVLRVKTLSGLDWIGYYYECKDCRNAKKREWNKKNVDKIRKTNKEYVQKKKSEVEQRKRLRRLTVEKRDS